MIRSLMSLGESASAYQKGLYSNRFEIYPENKIDNHIHRYIFVFASCIIACMYNRQINTTSRSNVMHDVLNVPVLWRQLCPYFEMRISNRFRIWWNYLLLWKQQWCYLGPFFIFCWISPIFFNFVNTKTTAITNSNHTIFIIIIPSQHR